MNEDIIRTFANQASEYAEGLELNQGELTPELLKARDLKFAELIVRECVEIAQDRANFPGYPPNDVNDIIDEIREHFGVEE